MNKSRRSRQSKNPADIETLLSIVDDNRLMHKNYLGKRVPMINVSARGVYNEDIDKVHKFDTSHTFSNVPRFGHQSYYV